MNDLLIQKKVIQNTTDDNLAIRVEHVSKKYELGMLASGTLYHTIWNTLDRLRGRNKRSAQEDNEFWALKDINFEIKRGEVIGIIGRNGAGKSTLLKVLSRITEPSSGRITINGRIASLLEVGTGFHPELSGRENIFLNGSILGMTRQEIKSKFDEIVDFSGVEKFLDTPVKRYSSGMYVRLAFAVAAHLEPEILIIDEVLSVGDAEFQKKCIGKMEGVAKSGRTVLFVSHNMGAVKTLTSKSILLSEGKLIDYDKTNIIINKYLTSFAGNQSSMFSPLPKNRKGSQAASFKDIFITNGANERIHSIISGIKVEIHFIINNNTKSTLEQCSIGFGLFSLENNMLFALKNDVIGKYFDVRPGENEFVVTLEKWPTSGGVLKYNVILNKGLETLDWIQECGTIDVDTGDFYGTGKVPAGNSQIVLVEQKWH